MAALTASQRMALLALLRERLWGTSARQSSTNLNGRTAHSLVNKGLIEPSSPELQVRGGSATLWQITKAGREALNG
mgnify:CR=1 FL=1